MPIASVTIRAAPSKIGHWRISGEAELVFAGEGEVEFKAAGVRLWEFRLRFYDEAAGFHFSVYLVTRQVHDNVMMSADIKRR